MMSEREERGLLDALLMSDLAWSLGVLNDVNLIVCLNET